MNNIWTLFTKQQKMFADKTVDMQCNYLLLSITPIFQ